MTLRLLHNFGAVVHGYGPNCMDWPVNVKQIGGAGVCPKFLDRPAARQGALLKPAVCDIMRANT